MLDEILGIDTDLPVTETHGATLVNFALFDLVGKPTVTAPVSFSVSSRLVNGPTDFLDRHCRPSRCQLFWHGASSVLRTWHKCHFLSRDNNRVERDCESSNWS